MSGGLSNSYEAQSHNRRPSDGLDLRQQYNAGVKKDAALRLPKIEEVKKYEDSFENESNASTVLRKTSGWFKRCSRSGEEFRSSTVTAGSMRSHSSQDTVKDPYTRPHNPHLDSSGLTVSPKKKISKLGRWFKKRDSKPEMALGGMSFKVFSNTRMLITISQSMILLMTR
jgi:hypothetical protein